MGGFNLDILSAAPLLPKNIKLNYTKGRFAPVHGMKAQKRIEGTSPLIPNFGTRYR